ncbi:hypothetical protein M231_07604 [Tremella mesenterica]|uniref:Uncharacterized protein n=1 Tax=Tremella mesenterica TaxID=5217 RepID=A0A4Q1B8P1_TREME|nr:hypothetical protein M231_07604 [Tremella mesenterica]
MPRVLGLSGLVVSLFVLGMARACWYYLYLESPQTYWERSCACNCEALVASSDPNAWSCCYPLPSNSPVPEVCSSLSIANCQATPSLASQCSAISVPTTDITYSTSVQYVYSFPSWTPSATPSSSAPMSSVSSKPDQGGGGGGGSTSVTTNYNAGTTTEVSGTVTTWFTATVTSFVRCESAVSTSTSTSTSTSSSSSCTESISSASSQVSSSSVWSDNSSSSSSLSSKKCDNCGESSSLGTISSNAAISTTVSSSMENSSSGQESSTSSSCSTSSAAAAVTSSTIPIGETPPPGYTPGGNWKRSIATPLPKVPPRRNIFQREVNLKERTVEDTTINQRDSLSNEVEPKNEMEKRINSPNHGRLGLEQPGKRHRPTNIEARETPDCTSTTTTTTLICTTDSNPSSSSSGGSQDSSSSSSAPQSSSDVGTISSNAAVSTTVSSASSSVSQPDTGETPPSGYSGGWKRAEATGGRRGRDL